MIEPSVLSRIDMVFERAISARQVPGGVVAVGWNGRVVFERCYGKRAIVPQPEAATVETIYDLASLTKVVATTPAIMKLVERGLLSLDDRVSAHVAGWSDTSSGGEAATLRMLLTHTSGLAPFEKYYETMAAEGAMDAIVRDIAKMPLQAKPGERFIYSDLGFILLGEIVRKVSGKPLDAYCRDEIFVPIGMLETSFNPAPVLRDGIAPTQWREDATAPGGRVMIRGEVHDGNARLVGGVSGHAGLFSTSDDLSRFCQMILNGGKLDGIRVLSSASVRAMTRNQTRLGSDGVKRGYGWDIDSSYSAPRGDLFSGGFGHTGWTGTSIWIIPEEKLYIIVLTNRIHSEGEGDAGPLRSKVANVVASSLLET